VDFGNSPEYMRLAAYYARPSMFAALGASRDEKAHSNFIAWLLSPGGSDGLGDALLRRLLATLALAPKGADAPAIPAELVSGNYKLSDIQIKREYPISSGRIDIMAEAAMETGGRPKRLRLAIENKVKSSEHDEQTKRYQEFLNQSRTPPEFSIGVYIAPVPKREPGAIWASWGASEAFALVGYQDFADYVVSPSLMSAADERIRRYLEEYLLALGGQGGGGIIMALSSEERGLLLAFWGRHKELIAAVVAALGGDESIEDADRAALADAAIALARPKDTTRYSWSKGGDGGANLGKSRLVLEIVKHYAKTHEGLSLAGLQKEFPASLIESTFEVASSAETVGDRTGYYYAGDPIVLVDGQTAYVCNQWRIGTIGGFIGHAESLGYGVASTGGGD
jgi:hypothetical protein